MKSASALLFLFLLACRATPAPDAKVTLIEVETAPIPTNIQQPAETLKVLGVGSDGMTTYLDETVVSIFYDLSYSRSGTLITTGGQTRATYVNIGMPEVVSTMTQSAVTHIATRVADASHFVYHEDPPASTNVYEFSGNILSCDLDGNGGGACFEQYWTKGGATMTKSYSGPAVPYNTLIVHSAAPTDGSASGNVASAIGGGASTTLSSNPSSALVLTMKRLGGIVASVVVAFLMNL